MRKRTKLADRPLPDYTRGEEIFNMVTHIVGGAFGIVMLILCIIKAAHSGLASHVICAIVFGLSMIILYSMSAIYHGLSPKLKSKKVMQILDHCSVFILIAGTYTPITICGIVPTHPALGWTIFGIVWGISAIGILLNAIDCHKYMGISMACYLGLGWCVVATLPVLADCIGMTAVWLLFAGGIMYTVGAILFGLGVKHRYMHSVFHIFVVLGSVFHGLMVLLCLL